MPCRPSTMWHNDPKLLLFTLARHKFVAKVLEDKDQVLEIGCGDGFASRLIHPSVKNLTSIDFDPQFIQEAISHKDHSWNVEYRTHNILIDKVTNIDKPFDAAFSLDVFEHIRPCDSHSYAQNVTDSLADDGVFICGCPSIESQQYASKESKEGHINCMTGPQLKKFFSGYFSNVFLFSMNDELLHTGFSGMAHYNLALCVGPSKRAMD